MGSTAKNYREQGGERWVVGGEIVLSGDGKLVAPNGQSVTESIDQLKQVGRVYKPQNQLRSILLEGFTSTAGYTLNNTSLELDTVNYKIGGAAVKATKVDPTVSYTAFSKNVSWDLSDMETIEIQVFIPDYTKIINFQLYLFSSGGHYYGNVNAGNFIPGWNTFRLAKSEFTANSSPNWSAITSYSIAHYSATGQSGVWVFDSIKMNVKTRPKLTMTFDDGFPSVYNIVKPIFDRRGVKFNAAIVTDWIGTTGWVTLPQLKEIYAAGHDVVNHSKTHADLRGLTMAAYTQAYQEVQYAQNWLADNGFVRGIDAFVYPMGWGAVTEAALRDLGFSIARAGFYETNYYSDAGLDNPLNLKSVSTNPSTTFSSIKSLLDRVAAKGGLLSLTIHNVTDNPSESLDTATAIITQTLDYAISIGYDIVTLSEFKDSLF